MSIIHKATAAPAGPDPLEFVMSDATVDRMGDVIDPNGWVLRNFRANPIALFNHDSDMPIGEWTNVRVENGALRGQLILGPEGACPTTDKMRAFIQAGMMRAVSVGFRPLSADPIEGSKVGGIRYKAAELMECSLVSVPANPNALQVAKSLNLSVDAQRLIFGKTADEIAAMQRRAMPGEPAVSPPHRKGQKMATLSERIVDAQTELTRLKDQLTDHIKQDNADEIVTEELAVKIEKQETALTALQRAEKALGSKASEPIETRSVDQRRPFAQPARKQEPKDLVIRSAVVQTLAQITKRSPIDVLRERYGEDDNIKIMLEVVGKSASAPATTTTSTWAAELVQTAFVDFLDALMPMSIYPGLRDRGGRFTFGRNGIVSLPARSATPTVAGSFVAQGAAIPVRQAGFTSSTLTPKKMAVITTFTREIAEHSTPAIEAILRQAVQEDTSVAIDAVLLDAVAASTVRPAGLRSAATQITAATGGGMAALVADIKGLVAALIAGSNGNLRQPVWIMNPIQELAISMTQNAQGEFPFADQIARDELMGYPLLESATVPAGTMLFVDGADFFSATGDEPRFDVSDQATLHMEDTTPTAIGTAGTPTVVAAPVRSLFQTDTIALRMIMDLNWTMRRSGTAAYVSGVTW